MPGFPIDFEQTPASMRMAAPEHGQHTEEILMDLCNCSWEDISRLKEQGVIP
jgi:crotonobetainyl-CoA:carnitine CoA-transferase CaiB-like acyl-CoA transferase